MSNGGSHGVVIGCEADGYPAHGQTCPAVVEIAFGRVEGDHVHVCTRLRMEGQTLEGWRMHYGFDILAFADALDRIHSLLIAAQRWLSPSTQKGRKTRAVTTG